jgi:two-component system, NtrC family, sensor kinase
MSVIHNITQRKRLEQEVIKAAKLASIAEMAYTLAHEINNPLTGMRLGLATLRQRLNEDENVQIVDNVMKDLNRIQDVVKSFLFSSRRPAELKDESISFLEELFKRILFHLSGQLESKQINVKTKMCRADWGILMDKNKMHQVFLNLLLNAIDATPQNGMIGISTAIVNADDNDAGNTGHNPFLQITITDTGNGISPEKLPKSMEPFYTTKYGGERASACRSVKRSFRPMAGV